MADTRTTSSPSDESTKPIPDKANKHRIGTFTSISELDTVSTFWSISEAGGVPCGPTFSLASFTPCSARSRTTWTGRLSTGCHPPFDGSSERHSRSCGAPGSMYSDLVTVSAASNSLPDTVTSDGVSSPSTVRVTNTSNGVVAHASTSFSLRLRNLTTV